MRVAAALVWLLCAGCRVSADYDGSSFRCTDGICPAGYTCVAQVCVNGAPDAAAPDAPPMADALPAADNGAPPDAAPDAGTAALCGRPDVFTDDFDDGITDPQWEYAFAEPGTTTAETGGELVVSLTGTGNQFAGYSTSRWFDLAEGRMFIEVPTMVNTATHAQVIFRAVRDSNNSVYIMQDQGTLYLRRRVAGVTTNVATVPYVPASHRWWQLRSAGGMTYWEASSDGSPSSWVTLTMEPDQPFIHNVRVDILAGTYQVETSPGAAHFDNFNGGAPATGTWCPTSDTSDDFDDGVQGVLWSRAYGSACTYAETGGQATFTPSMTTGAYCGYVSGTSFDLTGDSIVVELLSGPDPMSNANAYLKAERDGQNNAEFLLGGGNLLARTRVSGVFTVLRGDPWDAAGERWLRIRESGGTIYWDVSDGSAWTNYASVAAPFPVTRVDTVIGAGSEGASSVVPGVVRFDNYNLAP